ncbi:hypothetical protein [Kordia sp.]|uniref:hypothetical protein n=1 Tax=Kordia sp. TaxID=1965332 RepID=UPI0025BC33A9|nr:hypothetical protein [Kordia sp.]MCH2192812.1 hypothetical protein [Kordia sp.]
MKQLLLGLLFAIGTHTAHAQFSENHAIYGTMGLDVGNYFGANFGLNYTYQEKYSFRLEYNVRARSADSEPDDFNIGLGRALSFGLANPYDNIKTFQVTAGRIYKMNPKGTIRMNLSVGVGFSTISLPENWQSVEGTFLFSDNYTWDTYNYNTISFVISPKIEFPFTRHYGLSLSPVFQINKDRTYIGIGFEHMFGLIRKRS